MPRDPTERFLRGLYSAMLYLLTPVTVYHLIWRGFRFGEYFLRWNERYGAYESRPERVDVWLHAVSMGEVNAAAPLVDALRRQRPGLRWVVTTITPTGSERVRALWGDGVDHVYLPYDLPGAVGRFLDHYRPGVALVMETELWPNLLFGCRDRGIPSYILNARLSARSLRGYALLRPLIARALRTVRRIGAQSAMDAKRFVALGAAPAQVTDTGNLKFDIQAPEGLDAFAAAFAARLGPRAAEAGAPAAIRAPDEAVPARRPGWIAASTHEGEEAAILEIHARLRERMPDLLLLWAPRHPERFARVAEQARSQGLRVATRQLDGLPDRGDAVFVIDTLGELMRFYACADVAFVGGSLQPVGGHNLLEPAAVGTAIVTGPHLHNFADISRRLREAGALEVRNDARGVGDAVAALLADPGRRAAMTAAAGELVERGRGALQRTLKMLEGDLPGA